VAHFSHSSPTQQTGPALLLSLFCARADPARAAHSFPPLPLGPSPRAPAARKPRASSARARSAVLAPGPAGQRACALPVMPDPPASAGPLVNASIAHPNQTARPRLSRCAPGPTCRCLRPLARRPTRRSHLPCPRLNRCQRWPTGQLRLPRLTLPCNKRPPLISP
jgi:hypothetical protein